MGKISCKEVYIVTILSWSEVDVWRYIERESIPINPLYYAKSNKRYRSLGCMSCTDPIDSSASTIGEIVEELKNTTEREREGRSQDKEQIMRRLRSMGYM